MRKIEAAPWGLNSFRGRRGEQVAYTVFPVDVTEVDLRAYQRSFIWNRSARRYATEFGPAAAAIALAAAIVDEVGTKRKLPWVALAASAGVGIGRLLAGHFGPSKPSESTTKHIDQDSLTFALSCDELARACENGDDDDDDDCEDVEIARALVGVLRAMHHASERHDLPDTARMLVHMLVRKYAESEAASNEWQTGLAEEVAEDIERITQANRS